MHRKVRKKRDVEVLPNSNRYKSPIDVCFMPLRGMLIFFQ